MAKVFIVNHGPHDFSDAEHFGELVFLTDGTVDKFDIASMARELSSAMEDSDPDDYILLTSLTSLCSVACALFAHKHGRLNLLLHKRGEGYIVRSIYLNEEDKQDEPRPRRRFFGH